MGPQPYAGPHRAEEQGQPPFCSNTGKRDRAPLRVSHTERADGFVPHPYIHLHRAEAVSSLTYARLHKVEGLCPCLRVAHHTPENQGSLSIV